MVPFPGADSDSLTPVRARGKACSEEEEHTQIQCGRRVSAAMPAFLCLYAPDTTLGGGGLRRSDRRPQRRLPGVLKLRLAFVGSPCTEAGALRVRPGRAGDARRRRGGPSAWAGATGASCTNAPPGARRLRE